MGNDQTSMTRKELYDLIWSEPITRLSKQYGLSDVGFAKICKKYNIPRPPRGYWARVAAGQKIKKTPLPRGQAGEIVKIPVYPSLRMNNKKAAGALEIDQFRKPITIPDTLRGAHTLVRQSSAILRSIKPDHMGLVIPPDNECLDIKVSKKCQRRALLIMDGLIKALEHCGYEVFLGEDSTQVKLLDVNLKIKMREDSATVRKEAKKHDLKGRYQFGHSRFDYDTVLSGKLRLTIDEHFWRWNDHHRKNWKDTDKKRLEEQLHGFAKGIIRAAIRKKAYQEEEEEKQRKIREKDQKWQERERIRLDKLKQQKLETEKVSKLLSDAENWEKSQTLREYIAEVKLRAERGDKIGIPEGSLKEWLNWAHQQADRLDPFSGSPPSILDEEIAQEPEPRPSHYRW